jgi:hypothetical protein
MTRRFARRWIEDRKTTDYLLLIIWIINSVAEMKPHTCIETTMVEGHILLIIPSKICKIMDQKISEIKAIGKNEKKIINIQGI